MSQKHDQYLAAAKARGLMTESECRSFYKKEGIWTEQDDNQIASQELYLESVMKNKKNLALKSQIDLANKDIDRIKQKIEALRAERNSIFGTTCESYAVNKANDYFISTVFYKDPEFKEKILKEEDIDEIDAAFYTGLIVANNEYMDKFSEEEIQKLCLEPFYYIYYPFSDDIVGYFGKPIVELTDTQLQLISYTRIFKNIFERYDKIPDSIRQDPKALLDYGSISDEAKQRMQKNIDRSGGTATTLMGATKEDFEYVGLAPEERVVSLHDEAKKKIVEIMKRLFFYK